MAIADIVNYETEFSLNLLDPDGQEMGWTWSIISSGSKKAKVARTKIAAMNLAKAQGQRKKKMDADYFEGQINSNLSELIDLALPCVVGWSVSAKLKKAHADEDFTFNEKNLRKFLSNDWIKLQVDEVSEEIANFTKI